jgi:hypothetical protein
MARSLIILLCPLIICGCKKEKELANQIPPADTATVHTYDISSASIVELRNNFSDTTFRINVNKLGEELTSVALSATSIPQYTHLNLSSSTGTVPFEIDANIQSVFAAPGLYTITIAAAAGLKEKKEHTVNLEINPSGDRECADFFYQNCMAHVDADFVLLNGYGKEMPIGIKQDNISGELYLSYLVFFLAGQDYLYYQADSFGIPMKVDCNHRKIEINRVEKAMYVSSGGNPLYIVEGNGTINPETRTYEIYCTLQKKGESSKLPYTIKGNLVFD